MGVWTRGLVLALGVLAGCAQDDGGYRSFPDFERDFIEVSSSSMMGSMGPTAWRIYSNDIVYSQTFTRRQTVIRERIEDGLYSRILRFVNSNGINELEKLEAEAGVICPAREIQQPNGKVLLVIENNHLSFHFIARIDGADYNFSMSHCSSRWELSEYEMRLWPIFERVQQMIR